MSEKHVARNILFSSITWFLPIGLAFFAIPQIIKGLGSQQYGLYTLVLGFIGYSFNLNFGRVITKYIAEAENDVEKINEIYTISFIIHSIVATAGMILTAVFAEYLVNDVFLLSQTEAVFSFVIAGLTIFFLIFNGFYTSIIQGLQRFDIFAKVQSFYVVISTVGNLILIWYDFKVNPLLIWNLITIVLSTIIFFGYSKKLLPNLKFKSKINPLTLKEVLKFNFGMILFQVFGNLLLLFERTWIVRNFGESSLTFYAVTTSLAIYIYTFVGAFTMYFFPLISQLQDNKPKMKMIYLRTTKFIILIVSFLALNILIERANFLALWINAEFSENGSDLLLIHTLTYSILALSIISWQLVEAKGATTYNGMLSLLWLFISSILMYFLSADFKLEGVAVSKFIGILPFVVSIFYVEKWILGEVCIEFWLKLSIKLSAIIGATYLVDKFVLSFLPYTWLTVILIGLVGFATTVSGAILLNYFDENEKNYFMKFAKQL